MMSKGDVHFLPLSKHYLVPTTQPELVLSHSTPADATTYIHHTNHTIRDGRTQKHIYSIGGIIK